MARSLNRVQLIGNLTRDPELRYTPSGTAVCSFGLATNRSWTTDTGEKHEETEFHRIVAWNKLAELCSQFLAKGRKVYAEGRLVTRNWTAQDGTQRNATEVVIDNMILLDSKRPADEAGSTEESAASVRQVTSDPSTSLGASKKQEVEKKKEETQTAGSPQQSSGQAGQAKKETMEEVEESSGDDVVPDDIPF